MSLIKFHMNWFWKKIFSSDSRPVDIFILVPKLRYKKLCYLPLWTLVFIRLLFFCHIPLFTILFLILVSGFHTWWRCHPISVSLAQLSSHNSVISCLWITDRWLLSCASETKMRWQRHQVWKSTNNICKSKILLKKCSLVY